MTRFPPPSIIVSRSSSISSSDADAALPQPFRSPVIFSAVGESGGNFLKQLVGPSRRFQNSFDWRFYSRNIHMDPALDGLSLPEKSPWALLDCPRCSPLCSDDVLGTCPVREKRSGDGGRPPSPSRTAIGCKCTHKEIPPPDLEYQRRRRIGVAREPSSRVAAAAEEHRAISFDFRLTT